MLIEWPTGFWGHPRTDEDSEDLRAVRNRAAESVLANRDGRAIVAVSGSGTSHEYQSEAKYLGEELARRGFMLTTGGLDGVMFDVLDGFVHVAASHTGSLVAENRVPGKAIGIVPKGKMSKAKMFANDLPGAVLIETDLTGVDSHGANHTGPGSRNHVLIATADAVVCLPGSHGSMDEAMLAMKIYKKHVVAFAPQGGTQTEWHTAVAGLGIPLLQTRVRLTSWLESLRSKHRPCCRGDIADRYPD